MRNGVFMAFHSTGVVLALVSTLGGYDMPVYGKILKEYAEQQMPIWEASDILYPSIYVPTLVMGEDEKIKHTSRPP